METRALRFNLSPGRTITGGKEIQKAKAKEGIGVCVGRGADGIVRKGNIFALASPSCHPAAGEAPAISAPSPNQGSAQPPQEAANCLLRETL